MQLDDLYISDDSALLSHTHQQIQMKIVGEAAVSDVVGFNIHKKTNILKFHTDITNQVTLDGEDLDELECLMYLSNIIDKQGGSDADVNARNGNANATLLQLENI
ncbi:unnamed protein product [Schistosoma curassoni]|uniref:PITH domain-containing protein n=1 Tax=Schistosoma curassoni TaxID=6186 RepID=A0A183KXH6_9TREM|nr:unnamed protein product [Schistosoma curassoni]